MNPIRLHFIQTCLLQGSPPTTQGLRYLDVGCGGGILSEALARLKSTESVLGVDASTEVLKVAESHKRTDPELVGRLRYLNTTIEGLKDSLGPEEKFDIVG